MTAKWKRWTCALLCMVLLAGNLPPAAFADDSEIWDEDNGVPCAEAEAHLEPPVSEEPHAALGVAMQSNDLRSTNTIVYLGQNKNFSCSYSSNASNQSHSWRSSASSVASIVSSSRGDAVVRGVSAGTCTIYYDFSGTIPHYNAVYGFWYNEPVSTNVSWTVEVKGVYATLDANGGSVSESRIIVGANESGTYGYLPTPTRAGYRFDGWSDNGSYVSENSTVYGYYNRTLTAHWTQIKYDVAFDGNGAGSGSVADKKDLLYSDTITIPECGYTRKGYTFTGWNTQPDASGTTYQPGDTVSGLTSTPDKTVTLYAIWGSTSEDISTFDVTFPADDKIYDGNPQTQDISIRNGAKILAEGTDYKVTYQNNVKAGTATVTVSGMGSYTGTITKTFRIREAQTLKVTMSPEYLLPGSTAKLTVEGYGSFSYTSSYTSVATVSSKGTITGVSTGTTTITISTEGDELHTAASASITVKVTHEIVDSGYCGANVRWQLDYKGTLTVSGSGDMYSYSSSYPTPWYSYREEITKVIVESGVTGIGSHAFDKCVKMENVSISTSVTQIGEYAFASCSALTSVNIPSSVTQIGDAAFAYCSALTSVNIPSSVTQIGDAAFAYCSALTSVNIPSSVTQIGEYAFYGCSALTSVNIPSSVTQIGEYAFAWCYALTSVNIPSSVTQIGYSAFYRCSALTSVNIPSSVTSIGSGAFGSDDSLTNLTVSKDNAYYCSEDNVIYSKDKAELVCCAAGKKGAYTIPGTVTVIAEEAFWGCDGLTNVTIPSGVEIGEDAFTYCSNLCEITFMGDPAWVGSDAFDSVTATVWYQSGMSTGFQWGGDLTWREDTMQRPPVLSSVSNNSSGISLKWEPVSGISQYQIQYKVSGGSWKTAGKTGETSFTVPASELESGSKYYFRVRCTKLDGTAMSEYSSSLSKTYLAAPEVSKLEAVSSGVKVTWKAVSGATNYQVLYKVSGGSWTKSETTTGTSLTVKNLTAGKKYIFTVRCTSPATSAYTGGKTITYLNKPTLTDAVNTQDGVKVSWEKVTGAETYQVLYKKSGASSWTKAGTTTNTSFTVKNLTSGTKYYFTVRCTTSDGTTYTSYYNTSGKSKTYLAAPEVSKLGAVSSGVKVTWKAVSGATNYQIQYKVSGGSWKTAGKTGETSFTVPASKLKSGSKYYFRVRCTKLDGTVMSEYSSSLSKTYLAAPEVSKLEAVSSGVKVTWKAVSGATNYQVLYKVSGGSWTKGETTTGTSLTVKNLTAGKKYVFTVRCTSPVTSAYTGGKTITYLNKPTLTDTVNTQDGVKVSWKKVTGAETYQVLYKKSGASSWTKAGTTTNTSFTVKNLTSGTKYYFTVRCTTSDGTTYTSYYNTSGKSKTYLAAPEVSKLEAVSSGVKVTWKAVSGATNYQVLYKVSGGSWTKGETTTGTSLTVKNLTAGKKYIFTVRCTSPVTSAYTDGMSMTYLNKPTLTDAVNTQDGVKVSWKKVTSAVNYQVLYKKSGASSWTKAGTTTGTSLTVTGLTSGTKYYFTVRCTNADGSSYTSYYNTTGKSITHYAAPKASVSTTSKGIKVSWEAVGGVKNYRVLYKTEGGSWKSAGDTTSTSLTVTGLTSGTKYYFTVRGRNSDNTAYLGSYDSTGVAKTYIATPKLISAKASSTAGNVKVTWEAPAGAVRYQVLYKKSGATSWTKYTSTTTSTSQTIKGLKSGTTYYFTVRAVTSDGSSYTSHYDTTGISTKAK